MSANLENSAVARGLERSALVPIPKKDNAKQCSNYHTTALISYTSSKFSKSYFNSTWTVNYQMFKLHLEKAEETRDQTANICWIIGKAREYKKNIYFCFIDYTKVFECVDHNKLWKILKEMGIPDHLTCLLRNMYAGQEATFRTAHGTRDWFQTGKRVHQGCILSSCLFTLYAEYIMRNARLDEAQAGIKTARRNINNLINKWHHTYSRKQRKAKEPFDKTEKGVKKLP